jgi:hypothetical protein
LSGSINKEIIFLPNFRRQLVFGCRNRENGGLVLAKRGKMSHSIIRLTFRMPTNRPHRPDTPATRGRRPPVDPP